MNTESDINFKISGSALSFVYYECNKSRQDQVGFLIGEKHSYITKTISDLEANGERVETLINITAVLPIGSPFVFCNNVGRIDHKKLKEYIGPFEKDICGWYIFRRNIRLGPLIRGSLLHRELLSALPHISPQSFILCCIGSEVSNTMSTHRYRHVFMTYKNRCFESVSVPIENLGQSTDASYKAVSLGSASNNSFNNIVSTLNLDNNLRGIAVLKALQRPLQDKLLLLAKEVQQSDTKAQSLVNEIDALNAKIFNCERGDENVEDRRSPIGADVVKLKRDEREVANSEVELIDDKEFSVGDKLINTLSKSLSDDDANSSNTKCHSNDFINDEPSSAEY